MTASSTSAVMRCGVDTERSTPQFSLNSHSFFGWFTRATRGDGELLLGEQRDHEVVLVVAGGGDDDVAASRAPRRAASVTSQASATRHSTPSAPVRARADHGRVLLDEQHLVAGRAQVVGDEQADVAGAGDGDPHQCASGPLLEPARAARRARRRRTTKCRMSPSWPTRSASTTAAVAEPRDRDEPEQRRARSSSASFLPAHAGGERALDEARPCRSGRSTRGGCSLGQQPAQHLVGGPRRPWRRSGCRAAGRSRPGGGRRCGPRPARSRSSPGRSGRPGCSSCRRWSLRRRRRPRSMPASIEVVAVEAEADDRLAREPVARQPPERVAVLVDRWRRCDPSFSRLTASSLPTRPQPTTTTCTALSLSTNDARCYRACRERLAASACADRWRATPGWHAARDLEPCGIGRIRLPWHSSSASWSAGRSPRPSRSTSGSRRRSRWRSSRPTPSRRRRTRPRRSCSSSPSGASSLALGLNTLVPISIAVAVLLAIVVTSYRQTIFAYPSGGGSYVVSRENLGEIPVARRRRVAARRLHPHRRGVDLRRRRRHRLDPRVPRPRQPPRAARPRAHRAHHASPTCAASRSRAASSRCPPTSTS